jgi:hypothetical protein
MQLELSHINWGRTSVHENKSQLFYIRIATL